VRINHLIAGKLLAGAALIMTAGVGCRPRAEIPSCPPGDTLMGAPPPKGQEVWCRKIVKGQPVKDGHFILYADGGGKLIEGDYRDGAQEGQWTTWYENGQRSAIDHYRGGLQDGLHTSWYANGRKSIEGNYRAGQRVGVWTRWDPSGVTGKQDTYNNGSLVR
jgi:hypothetical protein